MKHGTRTSAHILKNDKAQKSIAISKPVSTSELSTLGEGYYPFDTDLDCRETELTQITRNGFKIAEWKSPEKFPALEGLA